jgi:hypothetical protein
MLPHLLGLIYLRRREFADAERQIAIEIDPHVEAPHNNRGNALKHLERRSSRELRQGDRTGVRVFGTGRL